LVELERPRDDRDAVVVGPKVSAVLCVAERVSDPRIDGALPGAEEQPDVLIEQAVPVFVIQLL
jgi:hypothetical protein